MGGALPLCLRNRPFPRFGMRTFVGGQTEPPMVCSPALDCNWCPLTCLCANSLRTEEHLAKLDLAAFKSHPLEVPLSSAFWPKANDPVRRQAFSGSEKPCYKRKCTRPLIQKRLFLSLQTALGYPAPWSRPNLSSPLSLKQNVSNLF